jgi:hypothetical protein
MALKARLASLDAVPDALRGLYKADADGKSFILDVESVGDFKLDDTTKLRGALEAERARGDELKGALHLFDGIDPKLARAAMTKAAQMEKWTPEDKVREQMEAHARQLKEKFDGEIDGERKTAARYREILERKVVDAAATAAISRLKGVPELLLPHVKNRVKVVESDGDFIARVLADDGKTFAVTRKSGATGDMSIEELVESMKGSDVFGRAFEGSGAAGSGSGGSGGAGRSSGRVTITRAEARNPAVFKAREEAAAKAGTTVEYVE